MLTALASQTLLILSPWLPYIGKVGEVAATKAGEAMATKAGEAAFEKAQETYNTIHQHFVKEASIDKGSSMRALESFVITPEDTDTRDLVQKKLVHILQNDPDFVADLEKFVGSGPVMEFKTGVRTSTRRFDMVNSTESGTQKTYIGDDSEVVDVRMIIGQVPGGFYKKEQK